MALYDNEKLYQTVKELQVIPESTLNLAYEESKQTKSVLGDVLLSKELITEENLAKTVGDLLSVPFITLADIVIPEEILTIVPEVMAKKQHVISFKKDLAGLHIAMSDPSNIQTRDFIGKKIGLPVVIYIATLRDINTIIPQ